MQKTRRRPLLTASSSESETEDDTQNDAPEESVEHVPVCSPPSRRLTRASAKLSAAGSRDATSEATAKDSANEPRHGSGALGKLLAARNRPGVAGPTRKKDASRPVAKHTDQPGLVPHHALNAQPIACTAVKRTRNRTDTTSVPNETMSKRGPPAKIVHFFNSLTSSKTQNVGNTRTETTLGSSPKKSTIRSQEKSAEAPLKRRRVATRGARDCDADKDIEVVTSSSQPKVWVV